MCIFGLFLNIFLNFKMTLSREIKSKYLKKRQHLCTCTPVSKNTSFITQTSFKFLLTIGYHEAHRRDNDKSLQKRF